MERTDMSQSRNKSESESRAATQFDPSIEFKSMFDNSQQLFSRLDAAVKAVNSLTSGRDQNVRICKNSDQSLCKR